MFIFSSFIEVWVTHTNYIYLGFTMWLFFKKRCMTWWLHILLPCEMIATVPSVDSPITWFFSCLSRAPGVWNLSPSPRWHGMFLVLPHQPDPGWSSRNPLWESFASPQGAWELPSFAPSPQPGLLLPFHCSLTNLWTASRRGVIHLSAMSECCGMLSASFFFFPFQIEMKFTWHRTNHFKVNDSVAFSALAVLCDHHPCLAQHCPRSRLNPRLGIMYSSGDGWWWQVCSNVNVLYCQWTYNAQRMFRAVKLQGMILHW